MNDGPIRVLVVEDSPATRDLLVALLHRDGHLCPGPTLGRCADCMPLTRRPPAALWNRALYALRRRWMREAAFALPAPLCLVQLSPDAIQTFQSPLILRTSQSVLHRRLQLPTLTQTMSGSRIKLVPPLPALIPLV